MHRKNIELMVTSCIRDKSMRGFAQRTSFRLVHVLQFLLFVPDTIISWHKFLQGLPGSFHFLPVSVGIWEVLWFNWSNIQGTSLPHTYHVISQCGAEMGSPCSRNNVCNDLHSLHCPVLCGRGHALIPPIWHFLGWNNCRSPRSRWISKEGQS